MRDSVVVLQDLTPAGPLERVGRAVLLVRRGGLRPIASAWMGGAFVALALLGAFFLDRVEGIGALRPIAALGIVAAFLVRSWIVARVSRGYVRSLSEHAPIDGDAGGFLAVGRTALFVGFGLWLWGWGVLLSAGGGALGIALFLPLASLRGFFAPSWLARAGCSRDAGWRAFRSALRDTRGQRLESVLVEGLLIGALYGVAVNLWGLVAMGVLLGRSFFGLELAWIEGFLSMRNAFVWLTVTLGAAVILEPLRAAVSAFVYVDARVRADGIDLRAAIDSAIGSPRGSRVTAGAARASAIAVLVCLAFSGAGLAAPQLASAAPPAIAAESAPSNAAPPAPPAPLAADDELLRDAEARALAETILAEGIFRERSAPRDESFSELVVRVLEWLLERLGDLGDASSLGAPRTPTLPLPGPAFFLALGLGIATLIGVALLLSRARERREASTPTRPAHAEVIDPRERAPERWLEEANALAEAARFGDALRALYLASLVALDRRGAIRFDPSLTNWQYLAQLPGGATREDFRSLTRTFDVKFYGDEPASADDYRASLARAERILHAEGAHEPTTKPAGAT